MEKLIFTNSKGETIEFGYYSIPFEGLEGLGDVDASIQSQKMPYQDGEELIDVLIQARPISFKCTLEGSSDEEISQKREMLGRIFNPKLGLGLLEYQNGSIKREIKVVAEHIPTYSSAVDARSNWYQDALIDLVAPNPYWKSPVIQNEPMAAFVPLFEFPFEDEFEIGMEGHETVIDNNSDVDVPIEIEIKGPTLNPCITNLSTGKMIRVKRELLAGDVLYINTANGNKQVLLNGVNAFHWLDVRSSFFKLQMGENTLKYTADAGTDTATLNIKLQELYNAV